ncbi:MAG: DNA-processing protein DprA [Desulfobulbaceae bacterium]|nr:DNA-processing protein DprA [Desulfobulbaceae bacterium]
MQEHNLQDWLTLTFLPGIGCTLISRLLAELDEPAKILGATPDQLADIPGVGPILSRRLQDQALMEKARDLARKELKKLAQSNISVIPLDDQRYPASLRNIPDPPILIYCKGRTDLLDHPGVALVGSRSATTYGRRISFSLGRELVKHGICVISGMALGIDSEAHAGALAVDGPTIGVLGCGIDVVYPQQNHALFRDVEQQGLLVSEYPLGTTPDAFRFPERNRIISGLARGVVVVEATVKSGSLITAGLALEQGREVFAVPGRVDSVKSQGTHRLLQQGAKLVHGVEDILEELDPAFMIRYEQPAEKSGVRHDGMNREELHLLSCLDTYPVNIDELVRLSGYDPAVLADLLIRLELRGAVRQLPGQQYELCQ